jgi:choline kinase
MEQQTAIAVMAAGIGSRYGKGIKQLATVGSNGKTLLHYSVHDAVEAGFHKVIFIIRKDIEEEFRRTIGTEIEEFAEVAYVHQELEDLPEGFFLPPARTKPWGTGQAILAAREEIHGSFAVINADDYYGKHAYVKLFDELQSMRDDCSDTEQVAMVSFRLGNTLSENGGVTRGICQLDADSHLTGIHETRNIVRTTTGAAIQKEDGTLLPLDESLRVSMNMWGLQRRFLDRLDESFRAFLSALPGDGSKGEFLLPTIIDELLQKHEAQVRVLRSEDTWFGVTYQEDRPAVQEAIRAMTEAGVYREDLFSDLR